MARKGAVVTRVDFSEEAIAAAERLSAESNTPGKFHTAEVQDTTRVLGGQQFDIV